MNAELEIYTSFLRILLYAVLTTIFLLRAAWFPHFRYPSLALAVWWIYSGILLFFTLAHDEPTVQWLRTYVATAILLVVAAVSFGQLWTANRLRRHE